MSNIRPHDLEIGDRISFVTLDLAGIDGQELSVTAVNTYAFYGNSNYAEFTLSNQRGDTFFMSIEMEDGEQYLTLSKELQASEIEEILGQNGLEQAVAAPVGTMIDVQNEPASAEGWTATRYKKDEAGEAAKFAAVDFRKSTPELWDAFEYHLFLDQMGEMALEIEDYGDGEIEASLTCYPDFEEIQAINR